MVALTADQVTEYLQEIVSGSRIVAIGTKVLVFTLPSTKVKTDARILFSKVLSRLIADGVPTKAESRKLLVDKVKLLGKDPTLLDSRETITKKLMENLMKFDESVAPEALLHPKGLMDLITRTQSVLTSEERGVMESLAEVEELEISLMANSAEAIATAERDLFLLQQCVRTSEGKLLWKDDEAIHSETDLALVAQIQDEYQRFVIGLPMLFEVAVPEEASRKN